MSFDSIIFDFDGTLVDTADDLCASLNHALGELGRPAVDPASVRRMVGRGARVLTERGLAATGGATPELTERGTELFLAHYAANLAVHTRPFAGVDETLAALQASGYRLGVCTNKPVAMAEVLIEKFGWQQYFSAVLGGDSLPVRKPDPQHLRAVLDLMGGENMIFVGDSETDAATAHAAHVPLVLVRFGYALRPVEELDAAQLLDRFDALPAAVDAIQQAFKADRAIDPG